jgi:hypothetical protein
MSVHHIVGALAFGGGGSVLGLRDCHALGFEAGRIGWLGGMVIDGV